MENNFDLTVLVPVYNEEGNMHRLERELISFVQTPGIRSKVLFIDDGSTDKSLELIEAACKANGFFSFVQLKGNHGLSTAFKAGIDQADTEWIGYIDADLQTTPGDFKELLKYSDSFDLVTGIRMNRKDSLVKNISSKLANSIRRSITHDGISDTGCPLKIIRTSIAKKIPFFNGMHRFLPALVLLEGGKIKEVPVHHFPRIAGKSKYHLWNRLFGPLSDLMVYAWMRRNYIRYQIVKKG
ncbi:MAG: glycosyltransferase [Bacteroidota bacterium]|nr:glycosyltransferase [Bacteroidota bacterium]